MKRRRRGKRLSEREQIRRDMQRAFDDIARDGTPDERKRARAMLESLRPLVTKNLDH